MSYDTASIPLSFYALLLLIRPIVDNKYCLMLHFGRKNDTDDPLLLCSATRCAVKEALVGLWESLRVDPFDTTYSTQVRSHNVRTQ